MTLEQQIADLVTATTNLLAAVNVGKANLDASVAAAAQQAGYAVQQVSAATAQAVAALGSAQASANNLSGSQAAQVASESARDQATTARDRAIAAWASATAPAETLAAISKVLHTSTAVVKAIVYDTSKDSDGGAWRYRCGHTSWENEPLAAGKWLGEAANETAARAISGAATGDYFRNTTDGKFYSLNATSGVTEIFRGADRQFPSVVVIVAESSRVVIYNEATGAMWMVFKAAVGWNNGAIHATPTSVAALNGDLLLGTSDGLDRIRFVADWTWDYASSNYGGRDSLPLAARNSGGHTYRTGGTDFSLPGLAGTIVAEVAAVSLPNAPLDLETGGPSPTVVVASNGNSAYGVSVIRQDGTVVIIGADTVSTTYTSVAFGPRNELRAVRSDGNVYEWASDLSTIATGAAPTATYTTSSIPASLGAVAAAVRGAFGSASGMTAIKGNPSTPSAGLVAAVSAAYTSGWMPGDCRGAWLADTVAETVAESGELVTNGLFDTDVSGWTAGNGGTATWVSGEIQITNTAAAYGRVSQPITTIPGATYRVSGSARRGTSTTVVINVGTAVGALDLGQAFSSASGQQQLEVQFTAVGAVSYLTLAGDAANGSTMFFDNISSKRVSADRSIKGRGLVLHGSITKTAVATGAQLVAYSGFSAANYYDQPYASNLDFASGDFAFVLALKEASGNVSEVLFERAYYTGGAYSGARIRAEIDAAGKLKLTVSDGTNSASVTSTAAINDGVWRHGITLGSSGGNLILRQGGTDLAAPVSRATVGSLNNANATLTVGKGADGNAPAAGASMALLRVSATVPSSDQGNQIRRDERALWADNAKCTLDGSSASILGLAYDDDTGLLHAVTSWGRSSFRGLQRVSSEATTYGTPRSVSAAAGVLVQAGSTAVRLSAPPLTVRDEFKRRADISRNARPMPFDFDAVAAQTDFPLPKGWTAREVIVNSSSKREGATKDWTRLYDGFVETIRFAVAPGAAAWVQIIAVRDL